MQMILDMIPPTMTFWKNYKTFVARKESPSLERLFQQDTIMPKCACGFVLFEQSGFLEHFKNSSDTSKCSMLCRCEGTFLYDETIGSLSAAAFAEHVESDCKL